MCSTDQGLLDRLSEVLAGLASTAAVDRAAVGGGDRIRMLLAALAQLEAVVLDEVAAFDTAGACVDDGAATTAAWLRASARLGRRDASGLVHQARELRTLPATTDALQAGVISRAHAVEVVKAKKRSCLDADAFSRYEQILVELATHASRTRSGPRSLIWSRPKPPTATNNSSTPSPTGPSRCTRSET